MVLVAIGYHGHTQQVECNGGILRFGLRSQHTQTAVGIDRPVKLVVYIAQQFQQLGIVGVLFAYFLQLTHRKVERTLKL